MQPRTHFFFGAIFTLAIIYFFELSLIAGIIIFLSSVLIDVDHYIYYVYKKKDLNLKKSYNWFIVRKKRLSSFPREQRDKLYTSFVFLHGFEILVLLFILGKFLSVYFHYILIGFSFHLFLDIIDQRIIHDRIDRISLVYDFIKFRKLKLLEN